MEDHIGESVLLEEVIEKMSWKEIACVVIDLLTDIKESIELLEGAVCDVNNTVKKIDRKI